MKPGKLDRKLIAVAKANPPSDAVPYAFEQRIMARLGKVPVIDSWAEWSRALWRAAAPCAAIAIFLGVWAVFTPDNNTGSTDLSQDLEQTVFAAVTQDGEPSVW